MVMSFFILPNDATLTTYQCSSLFLCFSNYLLILIKWRSCHCTVRLEKPRELNSFLRNSASVCSPSRSSCPDWPHPGTPSPVSAVLFMIEAESLFLLSFFLTVLVCLKRAISFSFHFPLASLTCFEKLSYHKVDVDEGTEARMVPYENFA